MAYEIPGFTFSLPAGADFSAVNNYRFVSINSSGQAIVPIAAGAVAIGVRYGKVATGRPVTIVATGIALAESGDATIVAGSLLGVTATGAVRVALTGDYIVGTALEASASVGVIIAVLLGTRAKF